MAAATQEALGLSVRHQDGRALCKWSTSNSESVVQVLVALCEWASLDDARFVKTALLCGQLLLFTGGSRFVHHGRAGLQPDARSRRSTVWPPPSGPGGPQASHYAG